MAEVSNELIYDVLKQLQTGQSDIREALAEHSHQLTQIRADLHGLRSDFLHQSMQLAGLEVRVERIENRLELRDA